VSFQSSSPLWSTENPEEENSEFGKEVAVEGNVGVGVDVVGGGWVVGCGVTTGFSMENRDEPPPLEGAGVVAGVEAVVEGTGVATVLEDTDVEGLYSGATGFKFNGDLNEEGPKRSNFGFSKLAFLVIPLNVNFCPVSAEIVRN
jgi:hypothetical protein